MSESSTKKLTKKEKKALAFRSGKNNNKPKPLNEQPFNEEDAVPISEDINEAEKLDNNTAALASVKPEGKKRKRETEEETTTTTGEGEGEEEVPKKKKRQRGKKKSQQIRPGGTDEEGKPRLIVFVGNLPYKVTAEEIKKHFEPCGESPQVRLLTPKPTPSSTSSTSPAPSSKGCAFVQFTSSTSLQSALRLHHSTLQNRKINVELTAGGGGNSEQRKQKIVSQREKLEKEREKALKNKRLREGETEDGDKTGRWKMAASAKKSQAPIEQEEGGEVVVEGGRKKKVRDRRNRDGKAQEKQEAERKAAAERRAQKASSGANSIRLASGWGTKSTA
ncbi:hypothetical protein JCM3765_004574 [Sporobolomyces pararoseus]